MVLRLERDGEVTFVDSRELELEGNDSEYRSFKIRTKVDGDITTERIPWIHAGFGSGDILKQIMAHLREKEIDKINVYTPNPEKIADSVEDDEIVAMVCWLSNYEHDLFINDVSFGANFRFVYSHSGLRGILKSGNVQKRLCLESLIGNGKVYDDIAIVRKADVSQEDWKLLTSK